jgi:hypothetical protein
VIGLNHPASQRGDTDPASIQMKGKSIPARMRANTSVAIGFDDVSRSVRVLLKATSLLRTPSEGKQAELHRGYGRYEGKQDQRRR